MCPILWVNFTHSMGHLTKILPILWVKIDPYYGKHWNSMGQFSHSMAHFAHSMGHFTPTMGHFHRFLPILWVK